MVNEDLKLAYFHKARLCMDLRPLMQFVGVTSFGFAWFTQKLQSSALGCLSWLDGLPLFLCRNVTVSATTRQASRQCAAHECSQA